MAAQRPLAVRPGGRVGPRAARAPPEDGNTVRVNRPAGPWTLLCGLRCPRCPLPPQPRTLLCSAGTRSLQYQQRVKPGLDPGAARAELDRLRSLGQISADAPHWLNAAKPAPYYLLLGDAIVLPLAPHADGWIATTCVTQRTLTPTRRSAKSARKASLRAGKRAQRRTQF